MVEVSTIDDRGVHYIAVYKGVKAVVQLILAIALLVVSGEHTLNQLQEHITDLQQHASPAWSQHLVELAMKTLTPGRVHLAAAAIFVDGIFTSIEGYALHTRKIWGEWLVVVATGGLIPIEAYELIQKVRPMRALVLVVNIAVVVYLARRQWRRHMLRRTQQTSGEAAKHVAPGASEASAAKAGSQPGANLERPVQSVAADTRD